MIKKFTIGLIILVVGFISFNLIKQITDTLNVSERLNQAADRVFISEVKNKELKKRLSEIKSPEFVEEIARNKLGLGKEGETLVIIPDKKIKEILGVTSSSEPRLPNWLGWLRVFLH
ncbi:MAG: septum formation initiator family protein [Patescibacteria group bacterium]